MEEMSTQGELSVKVCGFLDGVRALTDFWINAEERNVSCPSSGIQNDSLDTE